MRLKALDGCLFLSYRNSKHFEACVVNDYGVGDSWIKLLSFEVKHEYYDIDSVSYMKSKKRVLLKNRNSFFWFDVESNSMKTVDIPGFYSDSEMSAQIFLGSLLRLQDSCGRVASEIRTRKRVTMKKPDTTLTFCIRDYENNVLENVSSHDDCYKVDSNRYTSSCPADENHTESSNPEIESFFPLDICRETFLHLPAKSLIRFRAVCKAFREIIDEPCFVRAHTNNQLSANTILFRNSSGPPFYPHYSFDIDALNCTDGLQLILTTPLNFTHSGSSRLPASVCNGLILVADKNLEMWNPLTDECLQLPKGKFNSDVMSIGLGYDYATDDYKVVVVDLCPLLDPEEYVFQTHVYSLRSDSWRMIGEFPIDCHCHNPPGPGPGVYLCGALHWTARAMDKIIQLGLGTETFRQLQWPPLRKRYPVVKDRKSVYVLGGCLVMTDYVISFDRQKDDTDVWLMKDYGAEDSWIKLFSISEDCNYFSHSLKPLAYNMKDTSTIFLQDDGGLYLYDVESNSMKKAICIHGLTKSSCVLPFSGSIFRLHDNCGVTGSGSFTTQRTRTRKSEMEISDTELLFCVRDARSWFARELHDSCYTLDYNRYCLSGEDED